jgi:hypothetical protein
VSTSASDGTSAAAQSSRNNQEQQEESMKLGVSASESQGVKMESNNGSSPVEAVTILFEVLQLVRMHIFSTIEALHHSFAEHFLSVSAEDAAAAVMQQTGGQAAASAEWASVCSFCAV